MSKKRSTSYLILKAKEKLRRSIKRLPVLFYHAKFSLIDKAKQRGKPGETDFLGYRINYTDFHSLSVEYREIFKNQVYHFETNKKSPIIFDGGGCIGISILYFKNIYPESQITVFEPDPGMSKLLRNNVKRNKIDGIRVVEKALHSKEGLVNFRGGSDAGKLSEEGIDKIYTTRLSNYIHSEVDFLKLNVEGSELNVLIDLHEQNKFKYIPQLCLEWHSFTRQKQNLDKVLSILERNDYKYFVSHFNHKINPLLRSPTRMKRDSQFYLLIHAKKYNLLD